jgi:hypothetical protein
MHPPEMRNPAAGQGNGEITSQSLFNSNELSEAAPNIQAFRLVSKFGLAFETAVVVAALAWGIAR